MRAAIEEVVGTVVTEERRAGLLAEAVALAGLDGLPSRGEELARFLDGPLRMVLLGALSTHVADALVDDVRRAAARLGAFEERGDVLDDPFEEVEDSAVRLSGPRVRELYVVLVTADPAVFSCLSRALPPTAIIARHRDVTTVPHDPADEAAVFVLDVRAGALPPPAALWPAIRGREIVLWGADAWSDARVAIALGPSRSWLRCRSTADASEIVAMCHALALAASVRTG
jgi:hypothetical protein